MKTNRFAIVATALCVVTGARAAEQAAVVKDNRVNIRGQATLHSEVITQLKKGETVIVLEEIKVKAPKPGEPKAWLRIALPSNTPVWVFNGFVTNNTVGVPKLNVRAGPGENYSVVARLEKGAALKPLRTSGAWMEIETPSGATAFVAAETVTRKSSATEAIASTKRDTAATPSLLEPTTPMRPGSDPTTSGVRLDPITTARTSTPAPQPITVAPPTLVRIEPVPITALPAPTTPIPVPTPAPATTAPQPLAALPALAPAAVTPAPAAPGTAAPAVEAAAKGEPTTIAGFDGYSQIDVPPVKRTLWSRIFGWGGGPPSAEQLKAEQKAKPAPKRAPAFAATNSPPPVIESEPGPPRMVTREGVVKKAWNVQAPSNWELTDIYSGRVINYLYTTNESIPWAAIKGRVVLVTGEEGIDRRWPKTPVLRIETLKTVE
jgi:uncharacterized protein YraI